MWSDKDRKRSDQRKRVFGNAAFRPSLETLKKCGHGSHTAIMISESSANPNLNDPDVQLMLAVQRDDASAFEELMVRYQGRVLSLLHHIVGNRTQAEDLTQEVFLRVFRARSSYQPGAKFSTWLFTISHHVALNSLRSRQRRPEVQLGGTREGSGSFPLGADGILAGSSTMPARRLDRLEMQQMVRLAIESLGERQRIALLLHKFEEMSYMDIAQIMGMTPQAVKSLLCRARLSLRDTLQAYIDRGERVNK